MTLPSAYLPPISWFACLMTNEPARVEVWEHYHKQTIRNRCTIDSPHGALHLTIPIDKSNFTSGGKCLMKDVRISSHTDWQRQHWHALATSYSNSPFFEYLQDDFRPLYERPVTFLVDFNEALVHRCCQLIDISPPSERTTEYQGIDYGEKPYETKPYYQVFDRQTGFKPDLSIIDLIFNMGPESILLMNEDED